MVPLSELATPRWITGFPKLDRYNGLPSMKISGGPAPGRSTGDALAAMEDVAAKLPQGFGFEWSATSYEERLSGTQAPLLFGISLIVVFLCLAALYESWSIPFAVMLVVPLGVFGSVLAVGLRGLPDDVYFKVGLIAIIGLSSKNAILIIQFARELQDQGMGLVEATLEACRLRFRPILMTSIAFLVAVIAARDLHRRGRREPSRHRHRRRGRHDHGHRARGVPGAGVLRRRATLLPRPRAPRRPPGGSTPCVTTIALALRRAVPAGHRRAGRGCSFVPTLERPAPPVAAQWPQAYGPDGTRAVTGLAWQQFLPDPRLQALVTAALENNRDLRIAVARVDEARALHGIAAPTGCRP